MSTKQAPPLNYYNLDTAPIIHLTDLDPLGAGNIAIKQDPAYYYTDIYNHNTPYYDDVNIK